MRRKKKPQLLDQKSLLDLIFCKNGYCRDSSCKKPMLDFIKNQMVKGKFDCSENKPVSKPMTHGETILPPYIYFPAWNYQSFMKVVNKFVKVEFPASFSIGLPTSSLLDLSSFSESIFRNFKSLKKTYRMIKDDRPQKHYSEIHWLKEYNPNLPEKKDSIKDGEIFYTGITLKELIFLEVMCRFIGVSPLIPPRSFIICSGTRLVHKEKLQQVQKFIPVVMSHRKNISREKLSLQIFLIPENRYEDLLNKENFFEIQVHVDEETNKFVKNNK